MKFHLLPATHRVPAVTYAAPTSGWARELNLMILTHFGGKFSLAISISFMMKHALAYSDWEILANSGTYWAIIRREQRLIFKKCSSSFKRCQDERLIFFKCRCFSTEKPRSLSDTIKLTMPAFFSFRTRLTSHQLSHPTPYANDHVNGHLRWYFLILMIVAVTRVEALSLARIMGSPPG